MPDCYLSSWQGYFEIVLYSLFIVISLFSVMDWATDHVIKSWKKKSIILDYVPRYCQSLPRFKNYKCTVSPSSLWCMVHNELKNTYVTILWMIQLNLWLLVTIATCILRTVACFGVYPPDYTVSKLLTHTAAQWREPQRA